jgi:hypothetical protein
MAWARVSHVASHQEKHFIVLLKFGVSEIRSTSNAIFDISSRISNRSFENVAQIKYFGTAVTNQNSIQEETKSRLNSGNGFYHSVQKLLSSRLLSKLVTVIIYKTIILFVDLYGCETLCLALREKHRHRVF